MAKRYLGDGLYADSDGFGIWLTAEDGIKVSNKVYLEPKVYESLVQYVQQLVEEKVT